MPTVSTVEKTTSARLARAERAEDGGEIAAVAARALEPALHGAPRDSRPARRRVPLEVVLDVMAARAKLVESEEQVPLRRARLGTERAAPLR